MSDRELLELAAKAAGIAEFSHCELCGGTPALYCRTEPLGLWAPLTDDGDALRLAVKLGLTIACPGVARDEGDHLEFVSEDTEPDDHAATRRAIVRVAAEIGSRS